MKRHALSALPLFAVFLVPSLYSADSPNPTGVGVMVSDIIDTRVTGFTPAECRLILRLSGDQIADGQRVYRIHVTKAFDDLGRDLVIPADSTSSSSYSPRFSNPVEELWRLEAVAAEVARRRVIREAASGTSSLPASPSSGSPARPLPSLPVRPSISLRNPSRQSASIKQIEGDVELFAPTVANGGILSVTGIWKHPGVFVKNDALATSGVRIMYLTPESYEANRTQDTGKAVERGSPWRREFAAQFAQYLKTHSSLNTLFFVDDPKRQLMDLELQTPDGKRIDGGEEWTGIPELRVVVFSAAKPLPVDTRLLIRIAAPGAITAYPFKLENIPLP